MNATTIPVPELTGQLLDAADGILAGTAAVELIISHQTLLHRDAFRRIISIGASISTGQPLATIGWDAALRAWTPGRCPAHPPSRRSCGSPPAPGDPAIGIRLPTVPGDLDARNITLVTSAITRRQRLTHHSFRSGLALRSAAAPVLALIRSAGRSGSSLPC